MRKECNSALMNYIHKRLILKGLEEGQRVPKINFCDSNDYSLLELSGDNE